MDMFELKVSLEGIIYKVKERKSVGNGDVIMKFFVKQYFCRRYGAMVTLP